jgi:SAM-dependent methyltransferase
MKTFENSISSKNPWSGGLLRGEMVLRFLKSHTSSLENKAMLDIGAGPGILSVMLSKHLKNVVSLEPDADYFKMLSARVNEHNATNIELVNGNFLDTALPEGRFDIIMLNGVLEWMGMRKDNPYEIQRNVLKKVFSLLKPGGFLYLGIENRWFPGNIFHDPHLELPLVCVLPRKLADIMCKALIKRVYDTPIYSYWQQKNNLISAGFSKTKIFTPIVNYQYPSVVLDIEEPEPIGLGQLSLIAAEYGQLGITNNLSMKLLFIRALRKLGLLKLFTKSFIILAFK